MEITGKLIRFRKFLIVILILALPSFYGISNFHLARQRRNQMRNLADMRAIGTAIEAYAVDHQVYPPGISTVMEISHYLEPSYIKKTPTEDTWGNVFLYNSSEDGQSYTITSYGKDHKADLPSGYKGVITRFTNDIRFSQGSFTAFPEGI